MPRPLWVCSIYCYPFFDPFDAVRVVVPVDGLVSFPLKHPFICPSDLFHLSQTSYGSLSICLSQLASDLSSGAVFRRCVSPVGSCSSIGSPLHYPTLCCPVSPFLHMKIVCFLIFYDLIAGAVAISLETGHHRIQPLFVYLIPVFLEPF